MINIPIRMFFDHDLHCIRHGFLFFIQILVWVDIESLVDKVDGKLGIGHFHPIVLNPGQLSLGTSLLVAVVYILQEQGN